MRCAILRLIPGRWVFVWDIPGAVNVASIVRCLSDGWPKYIRQVSFIPMLAGFPYWVFTHPVISWAISAVWRLRRFLVARGETGGFPITALRSDLWAIRSLIGLLFSALGGSGFCRIDFPPALFFGSPRDALWNMREFCDHGSPGRGAPADGLFEVGPGALPCEPWCIFAPNFHDN